jgi:hypothetical protein
VLTEGFVKLGQEFPSIIDDLRQKIWVWWPTIEEGFITDQIQMPKARGMRRGLGCHMDQVQSYGGHGSDLVWSYGDYEH